MPDDLFEGLKDRTEDGLRKSLQFRGIEDPVNHIAGGVTLLHLASQCTGNIKVIENLISMGIDVNVKSPSMGHIPLHTAAMYGVLDAIETLISKGANVNARTKDGLTPLFVAAWKGHLDAIVALLKHGADIEIAANDGTKPIVVAKESGHEQIYQYLLGYKK